MPWCHTMKILVIHEISVNAKRTSMQVSYHRVGGEPTLTALPHHRTCGSAYGGSTEALESLMEIHQRDQPLVREVLSR
jgi:hypothetical protein